MVIFPQNRQEIEVLDEMFEFELQWHSKSGHLIIIVYVEDK